jgi:predicted flap endonuclease-1-like 5' DNA nuclease
MENNKNIMAVVISPAKDAHKREAKGFSLSEIKEAGKTPELLKTLNVNVDYFRKSKYESNIEQLKKLKPVKKVLKKKPYVFKEKKRTPFKPKAEKKVRKKPIKVEKTEQKPKITKKAPPPKKSIKEAEELELKPPKKEKKEKLKSDKTKLTSLTGLGPAAAKKLEALGVSCVEELVKENPGDLAPLIKGISEERISKWCDEGKEILK